MVKSYFRDKVSNETRELFAKPVKKYLPIRAYELNEIWQIDLFFIKTLNVKIVLSVIDIYSRKGWVVRISNKKASTTLEAFQYAVKMMGGDLPQVIAMDGGSEFKKSFTEYLKKQDIEIRVARGDALANSNIKLSQAIVERYNRTMRDVLASYLIEEQKKSLTQKDFDILSENYNSRKHRTIGATPNQIVKGMQPEQILEKYHIPKAPFKIGDKVRVLIQNKSAFKIKDKPTYSKIVYEIVKQKHNRYKLNNDIYYPYTRLRKSKNKLTKTKTPKRVQPVRKVNKKKIPDNFIRRKSTRVKKPIIYFK